VITLWEEAPAGPRPDGAAVGRALRACHERLASFDAELPPLRALLDEAAALSPDLAPRIARAAEQLEALPVQPLHGDAGIGNVLPGPRWNDWEDCCTGPLIWDVASLVARPRVMGTDLEIAEGALAAYGDAPGLELLDVAIEARVLQATAWSALSVARGIADPENLRKRRAWLGM
jgi:Ser/Thr protein kinase RdoA (MazF antagonist)